LKSTASEWIPSLGVVSSVAQAPPADKFRSIVEAHQSRVYSIALRILGDSGLAEEVAQDVFLALSRNLDGLQNDEHLLAWLRRVAVHRATDALRHRASRVDFAAAEFDEQRTVAVDARGNGAYGPAVNRMEILVASLPPPQRAVVLLRYQEDMMPAEIAHTLEMPVATVKSHLQRALKLLREKAARKQRR